MGASSPVIAAVDLTEISPAVVHCAGRLAGRLGAPLLVLHALDALPAEGEASLLPALRRLAARARADAEEALAGLVAGLNRPEGPAVAAEVVAGAAETAVVERARRAGAQLVVAGGPHPHLFAHSAAGRLVSRCPCPVLIVRHPPTAGYRNVVVGVDFSSEAGRAWQAAAHLAEPGARLVAFHARGHGEDAAEVDASLARWLQKRTGGTDAVRRTEPGPPAPALGQAAEREGADLLAVGRGARLHVAEALLGSVAERVVATARCDVLVAGAPPDDGEAP